MSQPTQSKDETLERLRESAGRLRSCGVRRLDLFGSVVRGEAKPESDVDETLSPSIGPRILHEAEHVLSQRL